MVSRAPTGGCSLLAWRWRRCSDGCRLHPANRAVMLRQQAGDAPAAACAKACRTCASGGYAQSTPRPCNRCAIASLLRSSAIMRASSNSRTESRRTGDAAMSTAGGSAGADQCAGDCRLDSHSKSSVRRPPRYGTLRLLTSTEETNLSTFPAGLSNNPAESNLLAFSVLL